MQAQKFILFDVQTTGTNPETSAIIEAGWGIYSAEDDPHAIDWQIRLVALGEATLSRRIQKLTGLDPGLWQTEGAVAYTAMIAELKQFLQTHDALPILVHYARFKRPFLLKAMADAGDNQVPSRWSSLGDRVACTYELARRGIPHLKSFSLRAVAGYAGYSLGDKKRSRDHLIATAFIWKYFAADQLPPDRILPLHETAIREKRLQLPDQPGVYYFLDQAGRILYVGKAGSLKNRLNSYFRGQKTKGSRLNEMLTRAVDFQTVVLGTELEALLVESDEIKRLDPPYNRLLKRDDRRIQKFQWEQQVWGPFISLRHFDFMPTLFTPELIAAGNLLVFGTETPEAQHWRKLAQVVWESAADDEEDVDEPEAATPEQAAEFIRKTLLQVLRDRLRARWILRLSECTIAWQFPASPPTFIRVHSGIITLKVQAESFSTPDFYQKSRNERLDQIDISTYDRLLILYHELRKGLRRGDAIRICLRPGLTRNQDDLRKDFHLSAREG